MAKTNMALLDKPVKPDYEALCRNLRREGTPKRVHFIELAIDAEIVQAVAKRFGLERPGEANDPWREHKLMIRVQRFLGYDCLRIKPGNFGFPRKTLKAPDTAPTSQSHGELSWTDEHSGPIQSWSDFERYPWPDPAKADTTILEWYSRNIPDDMCLAVGVHQIFEQVTWLMGYGSLCIAIYE